MPSVSLSEFDHFEGSGTVGGMSELSYSISEAGTQQHNMTASGMSNFMLQSSAVNIPAYQQSTAHVSNTRVDQCLDDFLSDVVGNQEQDQQQVLNVLDEQPKTDVNLAQAFLQRKLARQQ